MSMFWLGVASGIALMFAVLVVMLLVREPRADRGGEGDDW